MMAKIALTLPFNHEGTDRKASLREIAAEFGFKFQDDGPADGYASTAYLTGPNEAAVPEILQRAESIEGVIARVMQHD